MSIPRRLRNLWRNIVHRDRAERDLHDELHALHDLLASEKIGAGMAPAAARRAAGIELGRVESIKEQVRHARAGAHWAAFVQDVRYGVRLLVRSPVFTVFAVASLALGIGATAAIFALFDGIVLRTLPVPDPDRLVVASFGGPNGRFNYSLPYPQFEQIRDRSTTLAGLFATNPFGRVTVAMGGEPDVAEGVYVTGDYYETLRLAPSIGRLLGPLDDRPGQAVAVLNHAYWQRRFGGRVDIVGRSLTLNGVPFTIVGVEPAGFSGTEVGRPHDISIPMRAIEMLSENKPLWTAASATWIYMMGRLKPGATIEQAEREARHIFAQVSLDAATSADQQRRAREHQLRLESGATGAASDLRRQYEQWLQLLLMTLGGVLLLASLNVATLLLSRSDARQREIATRLAIGASRWRVIRQFMTESMLLAALASVLGLALASWSSRVLLRIATPATERVTVDISPDVRLVAFTILVACATCLFFGLIPAIRATSRRRIDTTRAVGGGGPRRALDRLLVASQIALSLVLLVGAGLFLRSLQNLWAQETGYDRHNVLMFSVDARLAGRKGPDVPDTYRRLLGHLREVRGAQFVTMSAVRPVSDSYYFVDMFAEVGGRVFSGDQRIRVAYNVVAPEYFATLGIPLLAGRDFDERDSAVSPKVAIISERMARHFTGNPVGQHIGSGPGAPEVIGVVADMRYARVKDLPREVVYHPIFQAQGKDIWYSPTFEVRYAGGLPEIMASVREAVARTDPALTMFRVRTLEQQTQDSFSRERLLAMLTSYFGAFAVLLACIGLYGLMSYAVTRRTAEIGLRIALGAHPSTVRRLVVRDAAVTAVAGVAAGLFGTFALVGFIRSQLFGVQPHDPVVLAGATAVLLAMALAAAYVPARRASRIDPLIALRHE
jgi:predicted permease